MTIYKAVNQFLVMIRSAMQSSVGNSIAQETVKKNLHDVFLWQFLFSVISTWCASCMLSLYQPFMIIWMGNNMLLPMLDVSLFVIWFSVDIVQQAHFLYLTGAGLWNDLKYSYLFNTCCNLILNILLGKLFGVTGIIVASLVTCIISGTFWQCIIIFKRYFHTSARPYILMQFKYFAVSAIIAITSYFVTKQFLVGGLYGLGIKFILCTFISIILLFAFYHKSPYFRDALILVKNGIVRKGAN
jgi:O-antigen/teichoic acid export membrane protein